MRRRGTSVVDADVKTAAVGVLATAWMKGKERECAVSCVRTSDDDGRSRRDVYGRTRRGRAFGNTAAAEGGSNQQPATSSSRVGLVGGCRGEWCVVRFGCLLGVEGLLGGRLLCRSGPSCDGFSTAQGAVLDWPDCGGGD